MLSLWIWVLPDPRVMPATRLVRVWWANDLILPSLLFQSRLLLGITDIPIPLDVLAASVVTFVVIPLIFGYLSNRLLLRFKGGMVQRCSCTG